MSSYSTQPILMNLRGCLCDQVNSLTGTGFQYVLYFIYLKLDKPTYSCNILPTWSNTLHKNTD